MNFLHRLIGQLCLCFIIYNSRKMDSTAKLKEEEKIEGRFYLIEQKNDLMQNLFGCFCEASNEYVISESDPNFAVSTKKGIIREDSQCLSRVFCVCNRPFTASLKMLNEEIAECERPCKCWIEFSPCLENELVVRLKSGRTLGILKVPCWCYAGTYFACADAHIQVLSAENNTLMYTIQGNFWQKSNICPCFRCCYCPNIEYNIFDSQNLKVGKISNIYNGCCTELFSRADKFGIQFPFKADETKKILLMFAAIYLDYLRYETPICCCGID